jgi:dipeptidyl aminopeptidase/acylaminoacyl peptidase
MAERLRGGVSWWIGTDELGGIANPGRPDLQRPPHWRLEMVAAMERPRHCEVAPDGRTVSFVLDRDTSDVWVIDVDRSATVGHPQQVTTGRALAAYWEDGGASWSPDGERLAYVDDGAVHVVAASGGVARRVCTGSSPVWLDDMTAIIGVDRDGATALATIAVDEPWPALLAADGGDCIGATVSPDRSRVAYLVFHHDDLNCTSLRVVDVESRVARTVCHERSTNVRSPAWSPDGARLAFTSELPGWYEVFLVDAEGGAARQLTSDAADFSELAFAPDGSHLLAIRSRAGGSDLVKVNASSGTIAVLARGGTWSSPRWCSDGSVVAVHESFDQPPRLCSVSADGSVQAAFDPTPLPIRAARHVVPEHVTYRSLDGREVYGWLYRPPRATDTSPCPAVVQPHGGPTSVTGEEWDGVAQYFLDKGYAWFAVNFRGSTTYGREFERADHGVWGVADTHDCLAAYDYLATLGWIDDTRVAIFGASYGSYMALHSVVDDPEYRYAAAVMKYGDCDILTSWAQSDLVGRLDLERMMGHPRDARDAYTAGSPIHRIEALRVPVLIAHGELDRRVSVEQANELVAALRQRQKTFEFVTYPTEGHGFLRREVFLDFYRRLERFFDWQLMP